MLGPLHPCGRAGRSTCSSPDCCADSENRPTDKGSVSLSLSPSLLLCNSFFRINRSLKSRNDADIYVHGKMVAVGGVKVMTNCILEAKGRVEVMANCIHVQVAGP